MSGVDALVMEDFDRAAPLGTGHVKVGGNYASDLIPSRTAAETPNPKGGGYVALQPCQHTDVYFARGS